MIKRRRTAGKYTSSGMATALTYIVTVFPDREYEMVYSKVDGTHPPHVTCLKIRNETKSLCGS